MIPDEKIEDIVSQIDIIEYVRSRGIDIDEYGSNINCPLPGHDDSSPSFGIVPEGQYFNCFGCEAGGNVLNFIMELDNLNFIEALKTAADYVDEPIEMISKEDQVYYEERNLISGIYMMTARYCNDALDRYEFLQNRYGLTKEFVDEKLVGFGVEGVYEHLRSTYEKNEILMSGLFWNWKNGPKFIFDNRLIFWYWKRGKIVYGIGRRTEKTGKYDLEDNKYIKITTRSKKHDYVSKQVSNDYIYNEDAVSTSRDRPEYVVITEGITDAMLAEQMEIPVISPVTRKFKKEDFSKLAQLTKYIKNIFVANDNEDSERGLEGALQTAKYLNSGGKNVSLVTLPKDESEEKVDLNDFLRDGIKTKEEFEKFLTSNSQKYLDYLIEQSLRFKENGQEVSMYEYIDKALYEAKHIPPIQREEVFQKISEKIDIGILVIREQFDKVLEEEKAKPEHREKEEFYRELLDEAKKEDSLASKIFKALQERGAKFYRTSGTDVTMIYEGDFYPIETKENRFTMFLATELAVNLYENNNKSTIFDFKSKAYKHSTKLKQQTWLFAKKSERTVYLPIGFENNYIFKITPHEIEKIHNGADDGVFVTPPDNSIQNWEYNPNVNVSIIAKEMFDIFSKYTSLRERDALLFVLSAMAIPLKRYSDTTPIIKVHGDTGAGKTQAAKALLSLFYGSANSIGDMTDASKYELASVRPFIVLDNIENMKKGELEKFLLYCATGGSREKRTSSDSGTITQIIDCLAILTAIHPFDKKELLNRSFDFVASRKHFCMDEDITVVNDRISERRDEYLSMWMHLLQECLQNIDELKEKKNQLNSDFGQHFKSRLHGYFVLVWQMAEAFLIKVGWSYEEIERFIYENIDYQKDIGVDSEKDTSPIFRYCCLLANSVQTGSYKAMNIDDYLKNVQEHGVGVSFECNTNQLLSAFLRLAREFNEKPEFDNAKKLMSRLNSNMELLEDSGWVIDKNIKKISGISSHRFYYKPKNDGGDLPDWYQPE